MLNNEKNIIENIRLFGNAKGIYKPFDGSISYPLHTLDFARTGFLNIAPTLSARDYKDPKIVIKIVGGQMSEENIRIKQATKKGFIECKIGGVADFSYPESKTRRGRVQENGNVAPTLTTGDSNIYLIQDAITFRKLTPKEYWRLMGFTDQEFSLAEKINNNTQLYKQAGNSIVVNVLMEIFKEMFKSLDGEIKPPCTYKQMSLFDYLEG